MGDDFTSITVTGIPWLTSVRLYDETIEHICAGHPEFRHGLPVFMDGIVRALSKPDIIHDSMTRPGRSVVFVSGEFTYRSNPVHIPVRILTDTTSGRVQTAYFSAAGTYVGKPLWRARNG
jgi:hypothetical protein